VALKPKSQHTEDRQTSIPPPPRPPHSELPHPTPSPALTSPVPRRLYLPAISLSTPHIKIPTGAHTLPPALANPFVVHPAAPRRTQSSSTGCASPRMLPQLLMPAGGISLGEIKVFGGLLRGSSCRRKSRSMRIWRVQVPGVGKLGVVVVF
jgi:hypothetical protein